MFLPKFYCSRSSSFYLVRLSSCQPQAGWPISISKASNDLSATLSTELCRALEQVNVAQECKNMKVRVQSCNRFEGKITKVLVQNSECPSKQLRSGSKVTKVLVQNYQGSCAKLPRFLCKITKDHVQN